MGTKITISHDGIIMDNSVATEYAFGAYYVIDYVGQNIKISFEEKDRKELNFLNSDSLRQKLLLQLESFAINNQIYTIYLKKDEFSNFLATQACGYISNELNPVYAIKTFKIFDRSEDLSNRNGIFTAYIFSIGEFEKEFFSILGNINFRGCHFLNDVNFKYGEEISFSHCSTRAVNINSHTLAKLSLRSTVNDNLQITSLSGLKQIIIHHTRLDKMDINLLPADLNVSNSFLNNLKISEFSVIKPTLSTNHYSLNEFKNSEINDITYFKNFSYKSSFNFHKCNIKNAYLHGEEIALKIEQVKINAPIYSLILSQLDRIELLNIKIKDLQFNNIKPETTVRLNDVKFIMDSSLLTNSAVFNKLAFTNVDLSLAIISFKATSFKNSYLFNINWGDLKNHISSPSRDTVETLRSLKAVYYSQSDVIEYLKFYQLEMLFTYKHQDEFGIDGLDSIILKFNQWTGNGISPERSLIILVSWVTFFTSLYLFTKSEFTNFCIFPIEFLEHFGNFISITSDFGKDNIFSLIYYTHKLILGTLYYQVVSSFRKYHRKSID